MIKEFYANLRVDFEKNWLASKVSRKSVEITREDLGSLLFVSLEGPKAHVQCNKPAIGWSQINSILRNSNYNKHTSSVNGLTQNARVVQHVLRQSILPKAGDRTNITPVLSMATYYILTHTQFDVADLIIRYIADVHSYLDPKSKKKHNLALGHVIAYILCTKYDIPLPSNLDHQPTFFTNNSFHILFSTKSKGKRVAEEELDEEEEDEEEEEEEGEGGEEASEAEEESAPMEGEASAPPRGGNLAARIGRMEISLDKFIKFSKNRWEAQEQRWNKLEERLDKERAWAEEQFDSLRQEESSEEEQD